MVMGRTYMLRIFLHASCYKKWNFSELFTEATSGGIIKWMKDHSITKRKFSEALVLIIHAIHRRVSTEHSGGSI